MLIRQTNRRASHLFGGLLVWLALSTCHAQEPYFGRQGFWQRTSKTTNQTFDHKAEPPLEYKEEACGQDARFSPGDPFFQSIDRNDPTCTYTDIKGSPNNLSWSFQCSENPPKREGKSRGKVRHRYDSKTETVVQQNSMSVDVFIIPPGRVINASGDQLQTARRLGDCQPGDRRPRTKN